MLRGWSEIGTLTRAPVLWMVERRLTRRLATGGLGRRVALRFVAGDTLEDGVAAARRLNDRGIGAMLDHLGENVSSPEQAAAAADGYVRALKGIGERSLPDANISVKLTQLGLDVSEEACMENAERVLDAAAAASVLVMIDMEASHYVEPTLRIFRALRGRYPRVGVCVQSYLRRTAADVRRLAQEGATVRVCKGAYLEPPEMAFPSRREVDAGYRRAAATLLAAGCEVHLATHDQRLIEGAKRFVRERGIPSDGFEFQMLYGIRRDLQDSLAEEGYRVRVYIPYGSEWYPYLSRRLAERPANLWFFVSHLVRRSG